MQVFEEGAKRKGEEVGGLEGATAVAEEGGAGSTEKVRPIVSQTLSKYMITILFCLPENVLGT